MQRQALEDAFPPEVDASLCPPVAGDRYINSMLLNGLAAEQLS